MSAVRSFRDLEVYKKLFSLHLEMHELSLTFPRFELYELGSQLRRASNSAPANIAEGWNNKHTNIYIEGVNRALSEVHEIEHHLDVAVAKKYIVREKHSYFITKYDECGKMLKGLIRSLENMRQ
ncbi:MAG: four helix bundle protein [Candidatus Omnitrophica bacterium]|nr:four helix bundle protein [Candidatus Omnitrophota bacterium]